MDMPNATLMALFCILVSEPIFFDQLWEGRDKHVCMMTVHAIHLKAFIIVLFFILR